MIKKPAKKSDPIEIIIKELKKYYYGTKRIKASDRLGDECSQND